MNCAKSSLPCVVAFQRPKPPSLVRACTLTHSLNMFGLKPKERPSIKNLTRNQLIMEVVKAQKALTGKTSTLRGARLVQREMEQRLFGRGSTRHFTIEEQRQYWAVYNEFIRLHADMYYRLGSDQIQKLLAEQMWEDKKIATEDFDLGGALDRAYAYLEEWEDTHL